MQESCTYGSVRGAPSNGRPYRNRQIGERFRDFVRDGVKRLRGAAVSSEHLPASAEDRLSARRFDIPCLSPAEYGSTSADCRRRRLRCGFLWQT